MHFLQWFLEVQQIKQKATLALNYKYNTFPSLSFQRQNLDIYKLKQMSKKEKNS